jgi:putative intracellular protease/amidase
LEALPTLWQDHFRLGSGEDIMKVLVTCAERYNGHELWTALGVMGKRGHTFEVVSQATTIRDEITLRPNTIDRVVYDVGTLELDHKFDAMMVVSGNMSDTERYWTDDHVLALVNKIEELERPLAAICCSVPTVRFAAKGKRVSFFPLIRSKKLLREAGAILNTVSITADQNLITAEHQMGSQRWANAFCDMLDGNEPRVGLVPSNFPDPSRERRPIEAIERLKRPSDRTEVRIPKASKFPT